MGASSSKQQQQEQQEAAAPEEGEGRDQGSDSGDESGSGSSSSGSGSSGSGTEDSDEAGSSEESDDEGQGDTVAVLSPVESSEAKWQRQRLEAQKRDALEAAKAYRRGQLPSTVYSLDLSSENARRERKLYGLPSFSHLNQASKEAAKDDDSSRLEGVLGGTAAEYDPANTRWGPAVMQPPGSAGSDGPSTTVPQLGGVGPGAAQGLALRFRRMLPYLCSDSAFMEGPPEELTHMTFKPTKLTDPWGRKKKKKKKKKKAAEGQAAGSVGEGQAALGAGKEEGAKKKRKKKVKKRRKDVLELLDPVAALSKRAAVPAIHVELKNYELHRMLTKQVAASFLPELPVRRPGDKRATRGSSKGKGEDDGETEHSHLEPPNANKLLANLKNGWHPGHKDSAELDFLEGLYAAGTLQALQAGPQPRSQVAGAAGAQASTSTASGETHSQQQQPGTGRSISMTGAGSSKQQEPGSSSAGGAAASRGADGLYSGAAGTVPLPPMPLALRHLQSSTQLPPPRSRGSARSVSPRAKSPLGHSTARSSNTPQGSARNGHFQHLHAQAEAAGIISSKDRSIRARIGPGNNGFNATMALNSGKINLGRETNAGAGHATTTVVA